MLEYQVVNIKIERRLPIGDSFYVPQSAVATGCRNPDGLFVLARNIVVFVERNSAFAIYQARKVQ